jgi:putative MATE family efflux protein
MKDLTIGNERKVILYFAAPMLLGSLFQQTYSFIDSIIVGKLIGDSALIAVGASFPIIFALISFVIGIASGGTIIISQFYGAKDYKKVVKAIDTIFVFMFSASIIIMFIGITFSRQIFELTSLPEEILPMATQYLETFLWGTILLFGFNGINAILRGIGDSRTPVYFLLISSIVNIILDFVFIKYLHLGIRGAALATVVASGSTFVAGAIYLNRTHKIIRINFLKTTFDKSIFKQAVRIGVPSGFQQTFVAFGMIALYSIVNHFDTQVITAYSIAGKIDGLAMLPAMAFGQALSAFVGQNIGANKIERVKRGLHATLSLSIIISLGVTAFVILSRSTLIGLFTNTKEVIEIGTTYLVIVSSAYIIFSIMFSLNGVLRGAGDTLIPMFITLFSLWIIRIPIANVLSGRMYEILLSWGINVNLPPLLTGKLGEIGVWLSVPIAWASGAIFSYFYYLTGNWKKKGIIQQKK